MLIHFDDAIAMKYGVNCAIILTNIRFWVRHNKANRKNFHEGYYWTYNTVQAFAELFPYLSPKQIRTCLDKLKNDNVLLCSKFNKASYDHTQWYTISSYGMSLFSDSGKEVGEHEEHFEAEQISQANELPSGANRVAIIDKSSTKSENTELPIKANRNAMQGKPLCPQEQTALPFESLGIAPEGSTIPDINTDINTNKNTDVNTDIKHSATPPHSLKSERNSFQPQQSYLADEPQTIKSQMQLQMTPTQNNVCTENHKQQGDNLTVKAASGTGIKTPVNLSMTLVEEWFDVFWKAYPRKLGKQNAKKSWLKIWKTKGVTEDLFPVIMHGLDVSNQWWRLNQNETRFILHASTWLNGRHWEDELEGEIAEAQQRVVKNQMIEGDHYANDGRNNQQSNPYSGIKSGKF